MRDWRSLLRREMALRHFCPATRQFYLRVVEELVRYRGRSPREVGKEGVRDFLLHLSEERRFPVPTVNRWACALRFLFLVVLERPWGRDAIPLAREPQRLPIVLSREEVVRFLAALTSLKYRAIFTTIYAAGLRISEACRLQSQHIDSQRMVIRVEQGKMRKDRYVMLSPRLLALLRQYWRAERPRQWLFPGRKPRRPIAKSTLEKVCRKACARAGLTKRVTPHTLRHYPDCRIIPRGQRRVAGFWFERALDAG